MSAAGREERVDVAVRTLAGDGAQRGVHEGLGEQARCERDGKAAGDEAADGELVSRDRDEARLEARGAAGTDDEPVRVGGGPVLVGQVAEADRLLRGELVLGRERDQERFAHQVAAFDPLVFASREGGVLKGDGEVEVSGSQALGQLVRAAFLDPDPDARATGADVRHGGWHETGEGRREGADAQERPFVVGDLGELECREVEAGGDGVGVFEQQSASAGELEPAGATLEQRRADLALERRHLMRDGGLREGERLVP
ncbi:MAG TPA: hypothetical protein VF257_09465 [Solirubrobacteraceae bacterium]